MNDFISKFKQTSYYKQLFEIDEEILLIYIGGSRCFGTEHSFSDYDITIVTLNGKFKNMHPYCYLMYNDKKIHWYYLPVRSYFDNKCTNLWDYIGILTLRGLSDNVVIYKNPKYEKILSMLFNLRTELLVPICYQIFEFKKRYIADILEKNCILPEHFHKHLYFLCLTSYCLFDEPFDKEFLKAINLSRHIKFISDEYKQKAIERLTYCKNYIDQNPLDVTSRLKELYSKFENEAFDK